MSTPGHGQSRTSGSLSARAGLQRPGEKRSSAVGHINETNGTFVETQSGPTYSIDWTHVVAVA